MFKLLGNFSSGMFGTIPVFVNKNCGSLNVRHSGRISFTAGVIAAVIKEYVILISTLKIKIELKIEVTKA